jgi:hypothetical protein
MGAVFTHRYPEAVPVANEENRLHHSLIYQHFHFGDNRPRARFYPAHRTALPWKLVFPEGYWLVHGRLLIHPLEPNIHARAATLERAYEEFCRLIKQREDRAKLQGLYGYASSI